MPKSPQPGHQSLWTSVAKSAGFMTCSRATGQHRPLRRLSADHGLDCAVQLRVGHRSAVVLQDEMGHFHPRALAHDPDEMCTEAHLYSDLAFRLREKRNEL